MIDVLLSIFVFAAIVYGIWWSTDQQLQTAKRRRRELFPPILEETIMPTGTELTDYIYIYVIKDNELHFDRAVSRKGLGPGRAIELVDEHKKRGYESFYTIGTMAKNGAYL